MSAHTKQASLTPKKSTHSSIIHGSSRLGETLTAAQISTLTGVAYGAAGVEFLLGMAAATAENTPTLSVGKVLESLLFNATVVAEEIGIQWNGEANASRITIVQENNPKVLALLAWAANSGPYKALTLAELVTEAAKTDPPTEYGTGDSQLTGQFIFNPRKSVNGVDSHQDNIPFVAASATIASTINNDMITAIEYVADLPANEYKFYTETVDGSEMFDVQFIGAMLSLQKPFAGVAVSFNDMKVTPTREHLAFDFSSANVSVFEKDSGKSFVGFDLFGSKANAVRAPVDDDVNHMPAESHQVHAADANGDALHARVKRDEAIKTVTFSMQDNENTRDNFMVTLKVVDAAPTALDPDAPTVAETAAINAHKSVVEAKLDLGDITADSTFTCLETALHAEIQMGLVKGRLYDVFVEVAFNNGSGADRVVRSTFLTIDTETKGVMPSMPIVVSCHAAQGLYLADNVSYGANDASTVAGLIRDNIKTVPEYMTEFALATVLNNTAESQYRGFFEQNGAGENYGRGGFDPDAIAQGDWSASSGNAYMLLSKSNDLVSIDPSVIRVSATNTGRNPNRATLAPLKALARDADGFYDLSTAQTDSAYNPTAGDQWAGGALPDTLSVVPENYLKLTNSPYLYFHSTKSEAEYWLEFIGSTAALRTVNDVDVLTNQINGSLKLLALKNSEAGNLTAQETLASARTIRYVSLLNAGVTSGDANQLQKDDQIRVEYKTLKGTAQVGRTDVYDNLMGVEMASTNAVTAVFDTTAKKMLVEFAATYVADNQPAAGQTGPQLTKTDIKNIVIAWDVELRAGTETVPYSLSVAGDDGAVIAVPIAASLPEILNTNSNSSAARWNYTDLFETLATEIVSEDGLPANFATQGEVEGKIVTGLKNAFEAAGNDADWKIVAAPVVVQNFRLSHEAAGDGSLSAADSFAWAPLDGPSNPDNNTNDNAFVASRGQLQSGEVDIRVPATMFSNNVLFDYETATGSGLLANDSVKVQVPKPAAATSGNGAADVDAVMVLYEIATVSYNAQTDEITSSHSTDNLGNKMDWFVYQSDNGLGAGGADLTLPEIRALQGFPNVDAGGAEHINSSADAAIPIVGSLSASDADVNNINNYFASKVLAQVNTQQDDQGNDIPNSAGITFNSEGLFQLKMRPYNYEVTDTQAGNGELIPGSVSVSKIFRVFNPAQGVDNANDNIALDLSALKIERNANASGIAAPTITGLKVSNQLLKSDAYQVGSDQVPVEHAAGVQGVYVDGNASGVNVGAADANGDRAVTSVGAPSAAFAAAHPGFTAPEVGDQLNTPNFEALGAVTFSAPTLALTTTTRPFQTNMDIRTRANLELYADVAAAAASAATASDPAFGLDDSLKFSCALSELSVNYGAALRSSSIAVSGRVAADEQLLGATSVDADSLNMGMLSAFNYIGSNYSFSFIKASDGSIKDVTGNNEFAQLNIADLKIVNSDGQARTASAIFLNTESLMLENATKQAVTSFSDDLKLSLPAVDDITANGAFYSLYKAIVDGKSADSLEAAKTAVAGAAQRVIAVRYKNEIKLNTVVALPEGATHGTQADLNAATISNSVNLGGSDRSFTNQTVAPAAWGAVVDGALVGAWGIEEIAYATSGSNQLAVRGTKGDYTDVLGANNTNDATQDPLGGGATLAPGNDAYVAAYIYAPTRIQGEDFDAAVDNNSRFGLPVDVNIETTMGINWNANNSITSAHTQEAANAGKEIFLPLFNNQVTTIEGRTGENAEVKLLSTGPNNTRQYAARIAQRGFVDGMSSVAIGHTKKAGRTEFAVDSESVLSARANGWNLIGQSGSAGSAQTFSYFVYRADSRTDRGLLEIATWNKSSTDNYTLTQSKPFENLDFASGTIPGADNTQNSGVQLALYLSYTGVDGNVDHQQSLFVPDGAPNPFN